MDDKNWYRFSHGIDQIRNIAYRVRASLLRDDEDSLATMCLPVSRHLAQILINNGYGGAHVVRGTFTIDEPDPSHYEDWDADDFIGTEDYENEGANEDYEEMEAAKFTPLHYWVMVGNLVIDITADQFNDELEEPYEEVVVEPIGNVSDRYTIISENFIEPRIMYNWAKI